MTTRIAINGFGRIGRNILRALYENGFRDDIEIVAINDLGDADINAHLTQYDSVHGKFPGTVTSKGDRLVVNDDTILTFSQKNPAELPWEELEVDMVMECTGLFTERNKAQTHINAGAKRVLISAPGKNMDATIVYGVNHQELLASHQIISNGSCTTNCLAPLANALHKNLGIEKGLMTTIHAFTNDQTLTDVYHSDLRRARSATLSMIPTQTGAASAVGLVLPELAGRLDGMAVRVPTTNVSLVDFTFTATRATSKEEINMLVNAASMNDEHGVLTVNKLPLVSIDFNHNPASCIFDATQTKVDGNLVKVLAWYDNEWGFSNRMLDNTRYLMSLDSTSNIDSTRVA